MSNPQELVLYNDIILAVPYHKEDIPLVFETNVKLDLSEFQLTEAEAEKLSKIMHKLTFSLSYALSKDCLAASVFTEIIPKNQIRELSVC